MTTEAPELIKTLFIPPFRYDKDTHNIKDSKYNFVCAIYGGARHFYEENNQDKQDALGEFLCELLNKHYIL